MDADQGTRECRCGTRLARDNTTGLCGACASRARDLYAGPPPVPISFWRTDVMRKALASWHMGRVIHAYRTHPYHARQLPQDVVAGWMGITQTQLSRIEKGTPLKDLDKLTQWAYTLRIPKSCCGSSCHTLGRPAAIRARVLTPTISRPPVASRRR